MGACLSTLRGDTRTRVEEGWGGGGDGGERGGGACLSTPRGDTRTPLRCSALACCARCRPSAASVPEGGEGATCCSSSRSIRSRSRRSSCFVTSRPCLHVSEESLSATRSPASHPAHVCTFRKSHSRPHDCQLLPTAERVWTRTTHSRAALRGLGGSCAHLSNTLFHLICAILVDDTLRPGYRGAGGVTVGV